MLQRHPVQKLHDDVGLPALLSDVVNRADIRMVQGRRRLRLPAKSFQRLPVPRHILRKELQGNKAVEPRVLSLVHDAHAAPAQLLDDTIVGDRLANHLGRSLSLGQQC